MAEDVVWGSNTTPGNTAPAREGREETRRCGSCSGLFTRPAESDATHRQVNESVSCPPDAEVNPITPANRWGRR
ncbi:hypothetical protein [Lentzea sp. NPDC059081]|uniref:hypothetical protein n=1 Tax=Lentzea sp. NPDC059081 TaxID=3346719 RepID=UPI00368CEC5A